MKEHQHHADHSGPMVQVAMLRDEFWISLALTVATLIWGTCCINAQLPQRSAVEDRYFQE